MHAAPATVCTCSALRKLQATRARVWRLWPEPRAPLRTRRCGSTSFVSIFCTPGRAVCTDSPRNVKAHRFEQPGSDIPESWLTFLTLKIPFEKSKLQSLGPFVQLGILRTDQRHPGGAFIRGRGAFTLLPRDGSAVKAVTAPDPIGCAKKPARSNSKVIPIESPLLFTFPWYQNWYE